jgi:hypothetical protein
MRVSGKSGRDAVGARKAVGPLPRQRLLGVFFSRSVFEASIPNALHVPAWLRVYWVRTSPQSIRSRTEFEIFLGVSQTLRVVRQAFY